jgi:putative membrane-bound dehydrogenase-like protein
MKPGLLGCALALALSSALAAYSPGHRMADRETPLPPAEAAKTFTVPDDLEIEQVLAEPIVRQPVFLNFDERGRMWVVQYLQYPAPAGLKDVSRDKFWRTVYDKVPEPPPRGVKGADKITIHEDTDGDGAYDRHKTFVEGLNIATSCVKGRGGVWVLNPPYLLFYPDANDDDVPDGDPVVHLEGFGLEDTHSVVNSLRWGPDGWLYAAQGSTVTANVRVRSPSSSRHEEAQTPIGNRQSSIGNNQSLLTSAVTNGPDYLRRATQPGEPPVYSQGQNIWRYHPGRHIYEIFAEGGGNAFGVEFDDKGRLFSGHNGGDTRGFHYMQGAYLRKGFEKHGELSNPYAFGYFPHMEGTKGERFSHTFLIYHEGALPERYAGKLFGCEPLQGRIVLSDITPDGSTFKTRDLERVVTSSDSWFRPVDIKAGPDGAIYIADWYARQVTHTRNQEGLIDRSNGRIYRLKKQGAKPRNYARFDFNEADPVHLIQLLAHDNPAVAGMALRVLADEGEGRRVNRLLNQARLMTGRPALASLWAAHQLSPGGLSALRVGELRRLLEHRDAQVRLWSVRLLGEENRVATDISDKLAALTLRETNLEVRAQLACTARRLPAADALPIIRNLILSSTRTGLPLPATQERGEGRGEGQSQTKQPSSPRPSPPTVGGEGDDARDPRLPLLLWWVIESKCESDRDAVLKLFEDSTLWTRPIVEQHLLDRLMRRFAAAGARRDLLTCARLLQLSPSREHSAKLMRGFEEAFKGRSIAGLPDELIAAMARHNVGSDAFRLRSGDASALTRALTVITDEKADKQRRQEFIDVLGEVRPREALDALLRVAADERDPALRKSALGALLGYDDARIPATVLKDFAAYARDLRPAALTLLASRAAWSLALAEAVDAGLLKASDVPLDSVRQIQRHGRARLLPSPDQKESARQEPRPANVEKLSALLTKHWPNAGRPTPAAMQQQIVKLTTVLRGGQGDPYAGQRLFNTACASCHTLFARGGKVGPDLTAYQRSDLDALLLAIVDPSAEIREGYESFNVETKDERSLTGFVVERDARLIVLRGLDGQNISLKQEDILEMISAGLSLMPEGLLDGLSEQEVRDLFAYLRSTQPLAN